MEIVTKQTVDNLNNKAVQKVKNANLAAKAAKDLDFKKQKKLEKVEEKKEKYKQKMDHDMQDILRAGIESYK